jgi:hypothetical protein
MRLGYAFLVFLLASSSAAFAGGKTGPFVEGRAYHMAARALRTGKAQKRHNGNEVITAKLISTPKWPRAVLVTAKAKGSANRTDTLVVPHEGFEHGVMAVRARYNRSSPGIHTTEVLERRLLMDGTPTADFSAVRAETGAYEGPFEMGLNIKRTLLKSSSFNGAWSKWEKLLRTQERVVLGASAVVFEKSRRTEGYDRQYSYGWDRGPSRMTTNKERVTHAGTWKAYWAAFEGLRQGSGGEHSVILDPSSLFSSHPEGVPSHSGKYYESREEFRPEWFAMPGDAPSK